MFSLTSRDIFVHFKQRKIFLFIFIGKVFFMYIVETECFPSFLIQIKNLHTFLCSMQKLEEIYPVCYFTSAKIMFLL